MAERIILCPPSERVMPDGTRPGPCHVYGVVRCPDLNRCEPRGRCSTARRAGPPDTEGGGA